MNKVLRIEIESINYIMFLNNVCMFPCRLYFCVPMRSTLFQVPVHDGTKIVSVIFPEVLRVQRGDKENSAGVRPREISETFINN